MILALGINGSSTITEAAIFLISLHMIKKTKIKMTPDVRIKSEEFKQIISDQKYSTDRNLDPLPDLETEDYVTNIGKKTAGSNTNTSVYCLTNKGQLLFLGIKEDSSIKLKVSTDKLEKFIRNSAKTNLYFAYVSNMIEHIPLELIIHIFIKPIRDMLERLPVFRDNDVRLFIPNFSMAVGLEYGKTILHYMLEFYKNRIPSQKISENPKLVSLEEIKKRTIIPSKIGADW